MADSLIDWLIINTRLIDCTRMTDRMNQVDYTKLVNWLIEWLIVPGWLIHLLYQVNSLVHWLIVPGWLIDYTMLIDWLIAPDWLIEWFYQVDWLIDWLYQVDCMNPLLEIVPPELVTLFISNISGKQTVFLSFHLSVYPSVHLYVCPSICLSCLFIYPSSNHFFCLIRLIRLSFYLSILCLSVYLSIRLPVYRSTGLSVYPLSVYSSIHPSIHQLV